MTAADERIRPTDAVEIARNESAARPRWLDSPIPQC
jgi:hypothetical protein